MSLPENVSTPPLVTTEWFEKHLCDSNFRVIEIFSKPENSSGKMGHIPGIASFFCKDLHGMGPTTNLSEAKFLVAGLVMRELEKTILFIFLEIRFSLVTMLIGRH